MSRHPASSSSAARLAQALAVVALAAGIGAAAAQGSAPDSTARHRHASMCVAELKHEVQGLRERAQAGAQNLRPEMIRLTEWGFSFVGTAYKAGLRKPLADQLLKEAEAELPRLGPEARRQLGADCRAEGARLYKNANFLEQALVTNRARARVDELLRPPTRP